MSDKPPRRDSELERPRQAETGSRGRDQLAALREAAERGWEDLTNGRYDDVADESLDDFIGRVLHDAMELRQHLEPGDI